MNPSTSSSTQGDATYAEVNGNGAGAPMDFSASSEDQPINLCDKLATAHVTTAYQSDSCSADGLRSRTKYGAKSTTEVGPDAPPGQDATATRTQLLIPVTFWSLWDFLTWRMWFRRSPAYGKPSSANGCG